MAAKDALNRFEIPVDDFDHAKMFHGRIFDHEMPELQMGPSRMGMLPFDRSRDGIGGAIVETEDFLPAQQGTLVYLHGADDLSVVLGRVDDVGGKVLLDKTLIAPGIGYDATFLDNESNKVVLHSMG